MKPRKLPHVSLRVLGHQVDCTHDIATSRWTGEVADVPHLILDGDTCTDLVMQARGWLGALHRCGTAGTA